MFASNRALLVAVIVITLLASVAALAHISPLFAQSSAPPADFSAIDAYVEAQMKQYGLPGVTLGIVQDDQIVHLKAFGQADDSGRLLTPQTPMMLGSLSKSFTATSVLQLVEQGKINLDAPVQQYIPWFRLADESTSIQLTVRQILNQVSGLTTLEGNQFWTTQDEAVAFLLGGWSNYAFPSA